MHWTDLREWVSESFDDGAEDAATIKVALVLGLDKAVDILAAGVLDVIDLHSVAVRRIEWETDPIKIAKIAEIVLGVVVSVPDDDGNVTVTDTTD